MRLDTNRTGRWSWPKNSSPQTANGHGASFSAGDRPTRPTRPRRHSAASGTSRCVPMYPKARRPISRARTVPKYYGLVESLDAAFGRLMSYLGRMGLNENTIVIYSSDHGDMLGCQGLKYKRWPYDESCVIPFIVRWPGEIPAGRTVDAPMGLVDVLPTLCGLAGLSSPSTDGCGRSRLWRGESVSEPELAYLLMPYGYVPWPGWRAVRTREHLYAAANGEPWLLYDLRDDPWQQRNLVKESPRLAREHDERLRAVMHETGDSWDIATTAGDIQNWIPGTQKFKQQDLGAGWIGRHGFSRNDG